MPKRTFWLVTGAVVGAGSSLWAERRVRRTVHQAAARLQPDALVAEVGRSARQVAADTADRLREAVASGREEKQRREEELWAELAARDDRSNVGQGVGQGVGPDGALGIGPGVSVGTAPSRPGHRQGPS
jgi:hypothetical protein